MTHPATLLKNARQPDLGLLTGGQPSCECLNSLPGAGYQVIVNLRPAGEFGEFDEGHEVEKLGLDYVHIPIADANDLDAEAVESLNNVLTNAKHRPAMIHCGSGNRVGALVAMHAYLKRGLSMEEALACGDAAGLTTLRDAVREKLKTSGSRDREV